MIEFTFSNPWYLVLIIPVVIFLVFFINKTIVRLIGDVERENFKKDKRFVRILTIILRSLAIFALLIALANPHTTDERLDEGNPVIKLLYDNSTSFQLFESGLVDQWQKGLEGKIPVKTYMIASGNRSGIGDGILNHISGDDTVLIISDGNNNYGNDLDDMVILASMLNTTINALDLSPVKTDISIRVAGPSEMIEGTENEYLIIVDLAGSDIPYQLSATVDGNNVPVNPDGTFKLVLNEGFHKVIAKVDVSDTFPENNIYYKTVKAVKKPEILYVSEKTSSLLPKLRNIYSVTDSQGIPATLDKFSAVVLNDVSEKLIHNSVSILSKFVSDGNGLVVIGGKNSYDLGGYEDSHFETLLPVEVGKKEKFDEGDINLVLVLDISGSTGLTFGGGSVNNIVDVEKSLALKILSEFRPEDRVGVVAFNQQAYTVEGLGIFRDKMNISRRVASLQDGGGTMIATGLRKAEQMLENVKGTKYVILISDGWTWREDWALETVDDLATMGTKVHAVGVGGNTKSSFMQEVAERGNGIYFSPEESQYLSIILAPEEDDSDTPYSDLIITDTNHFITNNVKLRVQISGYNIVGPKDAARLLVSTSDGAPVITIWRFGLGRVAAVSTDDGLLWSGRLYSQENSRLFTRTVNWGVGDISRRKDFDIRVRDTNIDSPTEIEVVADALPVDMNGNVEFSKVEDRLYTGILSPREVGFTDVLNAYVAVNYNSEYQELGMNPALRNLVTLTSGRMFSAADFDEVAALAKVNARKIKTKTINYRWFLISIALSIFVLEVCIRRIIDNMGK